MSGGSMDYLYSRAESAAQDLARSQDMERKAFGKHLLLVAKALHDIEWVDSCDYGPGDEKAAIRAALGENHEGLTRQVAIDEVRRILAELEKAR